MTLDETFRNLLHRLMDLQDTVSSLTVTLDEDKPGDVALASIMSDAALAANGFLEEARQAAEEAASAVTNNCDFDGARRSLAQCQAQFHNFAAHFSRDLISWSRMDDLRTVGRERGRGWKHWAKAVKQALEQCQALIEEAREALFACWRELAERMGQGGISVHATAVGRAETVAAGR